MITREPNIAIGILENRQEVRGKFQGDFKLPDGSIVRGDFSARLAGDSIELAAGGKQARAGAIHCVSIDSSFSLQGVTIGIQFHWERKEDETFRADLVLVHDGKGITAINRIGVEEYLASVVSSEMSAESPVELLKAHAITSRSWLVAMLERQRKEKHPGRPSLRGEEGGGEIVRWYDREDHALFDVCADDHCQRYQGISKIISKSARDAVETTRGAFLVYGDEICDARYSKACGGWTERFEKAWDDTPVPYLQSVCDSPVGHPPIRTEKDAEDWILGLPDAYCNTSDGKILKQVLPSFDRETTDFFRWKIEYSVEELSMLVHQKSGVDFGEIRGMAPLERGPSGRIVRLKIVGSKKEMIVGKELEIRKWLSKSHLYSSAFVVRKERDKKGMPNFVLYGAGWGHGVGLCQIGAAVMAIKGKKADEIVKHYFRGAEVRKMY